MALVDNCSSVNTFSPESLCFSVKQLQVVKECYDSWGSVSFIYRVVLISRKNKATPLLLLAASTVARSAWDSFLLLLLRHVCVCAARRYVDGKKCCRCSLLILLSRRVAAA